METKQITYTMTDTGHWLARCNHQSGVIELNRRDYPRLSPMMRDYIWVHEYVHLLYGIYDENECNRISDRIFISRGATENERSQRAAFVSRSAGFATSGVAVTAVAAVVSAVASLGSYIYGLFQEAKPVGYWALSNQKQKELLEGLIAASFNEASRGGVSAKEVFWGYMSQIDGISQSFDEFLAKEIQAPKYFAAAEAKYGFNKETVLPVRWLQQPVVIIGLCVLLVAIAIIVILKKKGKIK